MKQGNSSSAVRLRRVSLFTLASLIAAMALAACGDSSTPNQSSSGIHKIQHIVVIMQENRSFDTYLGRILEQMAFR